MKGLMEEFEEWLSSEYEMTGDGDYNEAIRKTLIKLEELKEKYKVGSV